MPNQSSSSPERRPLVFVLAPSFHGATILSILLDSHPEIVSLGDTVPRWKNNCACGNPVIKCDFWKTIIHATNSRHSLVESDPIIKPLSICGLGRKTNYFVTGGLYLLSRISSRIGPHLRYGDIQRYLSAHEIMADTACVQAGKQVFVDGEKSISKAMLTIATNPCARIRIIHLIRDPRAFVTSCIKNRPYSRTPATIWRRHHTLIGILGRTISRSEYLPVKFEYLSQSPQEAMNEITRFLGMKPVIVSGEHSQVRLGHQIGNTSYRKYGTIVNASERWREVLTLSQQREILRLCEPLSEKFGYRLNT